MIYLNEPLFTIYKLIINNLIMSKFLKSLLIENNVRTSKYHPLKLTIHRLKVDDTGISVSYILSHEMLQENVILFYARI